MSRAILQGRGKCNDLGTGAGFSAVCLQARGQREPSLKEREAGGGLGRETVAGCVIACLGVAGGGGEVAGPLGDPLSENWLLGDHNASQNCSTDEKRCSASKAIACSTASAVNVGMVGTTSFTGFNSSMPVLSRCVALYRAPRGTTPLNLPHNSPPPLQTPQPSPNPPR